VKPWTSEASQQKGGRVFFQTDIHISHIIYIQIYHFQNQPFHRTKATTKTICWISNGFIFKHTFIENIRFNAIPPWKANSARSRAAAVLDKPRFTGGLSKTLVKRILRFLGVFYLK